MTVLAPPDPARVRDEPHQLVLADLLGPLAGDEEEFGEDPVDRYLLGRLAPSGTVLDPSEQDVLADVEVSDDPSEAGEPVAPNVPSLAPSSLGLTCRVDGSVSALTVRASWARYDRVPAGDASGLVWSRVPLAGTVPLTLVDGLLGPARIRSDQPQVVLRGRADHLPFRLPFDG